MPSTFDYEAAKKAGYTDEEITQHLSQNHKDFDIQSAKKAGYSPKEINAFLSSNQKKEKPQREDVARTAAQLPLGALEGTPYGIVTTAWQLLGLGESLSELDELEERLPDLKKKFPYLNWPEKIDKQKYIQATEEAINSIPSIKNLASFLEEKTGLPLEAQTDLQKGVRFGSSITTLGAGGAANKILAGMKGMIMKGALGEAGIPEPIADAMSAYYALRQKTPGINVKELEEVGEGGIPKKSTPQPDILEAEKPNLSRKSLEEDYRKFADTLFSENRTYAQIKQDPSFKEKISGMLDEVKSLAEGIPEKVPLEALDKAMVKRFKSRPTKGITDSEAEKVFKKSFSRYVKSVYKKSQHQPDASISQLLEQYRKNNDDLTKYFEPGKSSSFNKGKRDALLEYNKAIHDIFEEFIPEEEFTKLLNLTNKRWQEISDVEKVEKWFTDLFDGKINFSKARTLLLKDKENLRRPFQRLLGEKGFKDFEELTKQLVAFHHPYSILKRAEAQGFKELAKLAKSYLIDPKFSKWGAVGHLAKKGLQILINKPQVARLWKDAVVDMQKGNFAKAELELKQLDAEVKSTTPIQ
jgi:hypothetical protein